MTGTARVTAAKLLTDTEWLSLPLPLRRRWWDETDYGREVPSPALMAATREALQKAKEKI